MRPRRFPLAIVLAAALLGPPPGACAADKPAFAADSARTDRALLRHLHFEYGLVVACGYGGDEVEAGYRLGTDRLERRLGIADDPEARFRELNLGWTEADADSASIKGIEFRESCRDQAWAAAERFRNAFRDTGETLNPRSREKRK